MAHPKLCKSHRRSPLSILGDWGRDLEVEARMILASFWAPVKSGLESMLRFGLRSDITTTIMDRSPGQTTDLKPASSSTPVPIYAARRGPKRFLAARHGGE